ncbi:polysaccharide biosynthesis C-terminal domain-containing protein [Microbacterium sp. C5A9]|uniref:oligosaccharide flippase family protein n=1 Tax=Microbacterium sp. C5A9 TaxID=2736663 RepID=UPI001F51C5CF|nr:polysaccharide biosynthesis C-terminal domain-containing protein [Microbacterium sp. C5A9]MCI1017041.1 polysaccharide biosynthesis C-terminal domain-containing protein [Microbacterium sp. C5A9]
MTSPPTARSELARGGALSFVGSAVSAVMGLVLIIVLGRLLGDAGSGVVLQAVGAFTIALGVARFGMDSAAIWILPRQLEDDRAMLRPTGAFLVLVSAIAGLVCAGVLFVGVLIAEAQNPGDDVAAAIRSIVWFLPVASVMLTALSATRALGKVNAYVLVGNVLLPTLRPLAIATAVGIGAGAVGAAVAWALPLLPAAVAAVVVMLWQLRRLGRTAQPGFLRSGVPARTIRYALPRVVSSGLEQLLIWLAVIIVGTLAGPAAAGVYGAASRFVAAGMIVDTALRVVVSPMFSTMLHRNDTPALESVYRTATVWLVLFSTPVYVLLAVFAPVALSLLGESFADGQAVLIVMSIGSIITFLAGNIHSVLLMSGRSGLAALNKAVAVAVNVALIYVLVPIWGITGAAVAWAVACALDAALASVQVRFVLGLRVSPLPGLYPLVVALITVAVPAIALRLTLGATWLALLLAAAAGALLFLAWCRFDRRRLHLDELRRPAR